MIFEVRNGSSYADYISVNRDAGQAALPIIKVSNINDENTKVEYGGIHEKDSDSF